MQKGVVYLIPSAIAAGAGRATLTPQVAAALQQTHYYVAEHAREARRFISSLKLGIALEPLHFTELNQHTAATGIGHLLQPALNGHNLGVLSDAGCPGIADPGAAVIREAHRQKLKVVPLAGPSSILLALMASGLPGQNFRFTGYLPINAKELKSKIQWLEKQSRKDQETQIFIETPYRADKLLQQLLSTLHPTTLLTVAKDLTGANEEIITQPVADWQKQKTIIGKTPAVFLFMAA